MIILETESLCKRYRNKKILDGITMNIGKGKIVGLLGPNGSGKTTFLKLIAGLIRPSSGSMKICNTEICYKSKGMVAFLPDNDFYYPWMKIADVRKVYSTFYSDFNLAKFDDLLTFMKLDSNAFIKALSKGMKEKLALSLTLARDSKLTILDEPLNGVDPIAREQILEAILKGFSFESSIIITSHLVNEVERILDEVYFLKEGAISLSGDPEEIRNNRGMTLDEVYREVFACC